MERIAIDILGELPESDGGNRYIVVISDYYTKWTESHPMPNMEASTVASILITQVVTRFGIPSVMHGDQGGQLKYLVGCFHIILQFPSPLILGNRLNLLRELIYQI
jgi:hypothetical protein